jgi:hypothetical protein
MTQEWIQKLADGIKTTQRDAAKQYLIDEHRNEVLSTTGKMFLDAAIVKLRTDINELNGALSGDITEQTISLTNPPGAPTNYKIARARFPTIDADLVWSSDKVTLTWKQNPAQSKALTFRFQIGHNDAVSIREAYGTHARNFNTPEEFAQHIMEELFAVATPTPQSSPNQSRHGL